MRAGIYDRQAKLLREMAVLVCTVKNKEWEQRKRIAHAYCTAGSDPGQCQ